MRILKLIVAILVILIFCIGYIYFSKSDKSSEKQEIISLASIKNELQASEKINDKVDDNSKNLSKASNPPPLNMTAEQYDKIMKEGIANGVVYTSLNDFDDITKDSIKQALENLNQKGSLSGGVKVKEFSDLDKARENLKEKTLEKMISDLDGFKSTPNEILEKHNLKLTGAQNFGAYNEGEGWNGIYKLYENNKSKVEIEQINLKPEKSTQQLVKETLNASLSNNTPAIYEELPSELIQKLTFVNDRNYYQINAYNLSKNEMMEIANSIILNTKK
ncbi:hypothetical protein AS4_27710 [Acinetobacter guillouiae]|uniref:hypothetical protein n=1 Tax=Acinetobacter guillouiae TaxID=106649 RepID=UPI0004EF6351|nr:hypothetical protein [Acinetobacter guillouiae]BAP37711.1 hypothetical protein AS4_27710 [Acinetobacter guillouiae]